MYDEEYDRLNKMDEETRNEAIQNVVRKWYFERYGETWEESTERRQELLEEKEKCGVVFELFGIPYVLTENDKEFFKYFRRCLIAARKAVDSFSEKFRKTVTFVSENNIGSKSSELINSMMAVGYSVFDELWKAVIDKGVYTLNKEDFVEHVKEIWLSKVGSIDGFVLAETYYDFRYENKSSNLSYLLRWMQELRKGMSEIDIICHSVFTETCAFAVVEAAKCVNKDGVLLNTYEYYEYATVKENILKIGLEGSDRRTAFIENMKKFPVHILDYASLVESYGDEKHEIEKIIVFFGEEKFYRSYRIQLVEKQVSEIVKIKNFSKYSEEQLQDYQKTVERTLEYYGLSIDTDIDCLTAIRKQLEEIDKNLRTVHGIIYDTREEAEIVRSDYALLEGQINDTDFPAYNLLNQDEILKIKNTMLSVPFQSDVFKNNPELIYSELEPILNYHIRLQTWRQQLLESQEPWRLVEDIFKDSDIDPAVKDKIKYWNFDGLKKYYPSLIMNERPVLFLRMGLFGWNQYFVLTNKRGIHINKNAQNVFLIDDLTHVIYSHGTFVFCSEGRRESLSVSLKYDEGKVKYILDVFNLLVGTLSRCDEALFAVPENYFPAQVGQEMSAGDTISQQIKGKLKNRISPFLGETKSESNVENSRESRTPVGLARYCSQCGAPVKSTNKFCSKCGNKLQ